MNSQIQSATGAKQLLRSLNSMRLPGRKLFGEILASGEAVQRNDFEGRPGWNELIHHDLVNCWEDDTGRKFCRIGRQEY